jgi:hypothetical protein
VSSFLIEFFYFADLLSFTLEDITGDNTLAGSKPTSLDRL